MPAATVHQRQGWEDSELRTACTTSQVPGQPGLVKTYFIKKEKEKESISYFKGRWNCLIKKNKFSKSS